MNFSGWHPRKQRYVPGASTPQRRASNLSNRSSSQQPKRGRTRSNSANQHHGFEKFEKPTFIQQPPPEMINASSPAAPATSGHIHVFNPPPSSQQTHQVGGNGINSPRRLPPQPYQDTNGYHQGYNNVQSYNMHPQTQNSYTGPTNVAGFHHSQQQQHPHDPNSVARRDSSHNYNYPPRLINEQHNHQYNKSPRTSSQIPHQYEGSSSNRDYDTSNSYNVINPANNERENNIRNQIPNQSSQTHHDINHQPQNTPRSSIPNATSTTIATQNNGIKNGGGASAGSNLRQNMTAAAPSSVPITKLELSISAKNLKDKDVFSKSDPICVVFEAFHYPNGELKYEEIGRTERIKDCLNPEWITKIIINYMFEERQRIKFEVYDIDSDSTELSEHDFLGRAECDLADIVAAPFSILNLNLSLKIGCIIIHSEEMNEGQNESMKFIIHGKDLDKKDFFGKSDPFLSFYRPIAENTKQLIHRTEVIKKSLNPEWKPFNLSVRALCQGDKNKEFIIECHDYDNDGDTKHDLIGIAKTTVNMLASNDVRQLELINEKKKVKKGSKKYKNSGILEFKMAKLQQEYTFLDYIHGGLELDFTVSVDFTASNGPVTQPTSLHFCNPNANNEYQMAIRAVLEICQAYNKTKNFNAFGFGAQVPPAYTVSHLFPLNLSTPEVHGIEGVMHAYATSLRNITFYGPTNFAPTINEAAKRAAYYSSTAQKYQILLIITDGVISDIAQTKSAIVKASNLPLSIIIIGVGKANFDKMNELDSDDSLLTSNGRSANRDIVQFVPFRKFIQGEGTAAASPYQQEKLQYLLAKEVLAEVPEQIVSYMKKHKIILNQPQNPHPNPQQPQYTQNPNAASPYPSAPPSDPYDSSNYHHQGMNPPHLYQPMDHGATIDQINVGFQNHVNIHHQTPHLYQ